MNGQTEDLLNGMADAGCTGEEIKGAERLMEAGRFDELERHLKKCRAVLMDKMHESQSRVDRMDYVIGRLKNFREQ